MFRESKLCRILAEDPRQPLLGWTGNSHAAKHANDEWIPMGSHFTELSGCSPLVIGQTATVDFPGTQRFRVDELLQDTAPPGQLRRRS